MSLSLSSNGPPSDTSTTQIGPSTKQQQIRKPADLQITAEHILQEAYEFKDNPIKQTDHRIADLEELHDFQRRKRTEHENALRRNRFSFGEWLRYAQFEIDQHDYPRARSVFERALEVDETNVSVWVRYIQCELKGKNVNHARNLLQRSVRILPRVDKLWYLYVTIEESLANVIAVRQVFENWLQWKPGYEVWLHYIQFEERYGEFDNCRLIFEKFVVVFPKADTWIQWANFEKVHGDDVNVFNVYKLAVESLFAAASKNGANGRLEGKILVSWIQWEVTKKHWKRIEKLYRYARDTLSESDLLEVQSKYAKFQRQFGDKESLEASTLTKRKVKYENELQSNPYSYEIWWDYLNVIEEHPNTAEIDLKQAFDRVIHTVPEPSASKSDWLPWIYIWLRYISWEEVSNKNIDEARTLFRDLLDVIPHKKFTFAKVWIKFAEFETRQGDLITARKILGRSMGVCPNAIIMKFYISLEIKLKEFDRVRMIYNKLIESFSNVVGYWLEYANLETNLGDDPRAKAIYDLAIVEPTLPDESKIILLNQYIQLQLESHRFTEARNLYERLIIITNEDLKTVIKGCLFELKIPSQQQINEYAQEVEHSDDPDPVFQFHISDDAKTRVRQKFESSILKAKENGDNERRVMLLEALRRFERKHGDESTVSKVESRLPKIVTTVQEMENGGKEEYEEFEFPDDILETAKEVESFTAKFASQVEADDDEQDGTEEQETISEGEDHQSNSLKRRFEADFDEEDSENANIAPAKRFMSRFEE
ncbi:unnamed protein product [Ambrosiozyma monospora]|uniref:Unnamed protein product n=1 Tax=Ambrosiozyma monospora TaxID=43982 RepID=A0ACB5SV41_AMBMO|nr:unnamed protein product [Ambrosiozyma monospora]